MFSKIELHFGYSLTRMPFDIPIEIKIFEIKIFGIKSRITRTVT